MTEFEIAQIANCLHSTFYFSKESERKTYQECVGMVRMAHGTPIEFVKIYDPLTSKSLEKLLDDIKFLKNKADEEYHRGFKEGKEACAPHIKDLQDSIRMLCRL